MPDTFADLRKGLNQTPLPSNVLVGQPRSANPDLMRQANQAIARGMDRKKVWSRLLTSTAKKPAVVTATPPAGSGQPGAPPPGVGVGGYSGANARVLGAPSNPGYVNMPNTNS